MSDERRIHFPPILNGLDYLESAVQLLGHPTGEPSARDIKYAVLHLQAAAEVLLKARLLLKDPKLAWSDPNEFDQTKHDAGDFTSVQWQHVIRRVERECPPKTRLRPPRYFKALANMRNRFQHLGVSESHTAVEALAIPVLDILLTFVTQDLLPNDDSAEQYEAELALDRVRAGVPPIKALVDRRMEGIQGDLEAHRHATIACTSCGTFAVMIDGTDAIACALCGRSYGRPEDLAWEISGSSLYEVVTGGGESPVAECAECGTEAAIRVAVASLPDSDVWLCLREGMELRGICEGCDRAASSLAYDGSLCSDCAETRLAKL